MDIKKIKIHFLLPCIFIFFELPAQKSWQLEFAAGPNISHTSDKIQPQNPYISGMTTIGYHLDVGTTYRINDRWALSSKLSYVASGVGITLTDRISTTSFRKSTRRIGLDWTLFDAGFRYYIFSPLNLYISPSLGITYAPEATYDGLRLSYRHISTVGFFGKLELGTHFYTNKGNFFVVGLRHVQGITPLEEFYNESILLVGNNFTFSTTNKGSYSSLFVGYGIQFPNLTFRKSKSTLSQHDLLSRDYTLSDGDYIMISGGYRRKFSDQQNPDNLYSNINGTYGLLYGYSLSRFSFETGMVIMHDNNYLQIDHDGQKAIKYYANPYNIITIPATIKYRLWQGKKKNLIGIQLESHFIVNNNSDQSILSFDGSYSYGEPEVVVLTKGTITAKNESDRKGIILKGGVYAERFLGNSTFLNIRLSGIIAAPQVLNHYSANYTVVNVPFHKELTSTINGLMLELGVRKPLKTFRNRK